MRLALILSLIWLHALPAVSTGQLGSGASTTHAAALEGAVEVDVSSGVIAADLCLRGVWPVQDTLRFALHRGMNVKRVRLVDGTTLTYGTSAEPHGVGLRYAVALPSPNDTAAGTLHDGMCVEYTGAFPVYDVASGDYRDADDSSVVAFNGRTLRARGETRWYPQPFDPELDLTSASLPFRLRISCTECAYIYVNGAPPRRGPTALLESDVPREVLLLAGDYPVVRAAGMLFLGEDVAPDTAQLLADQLERIQRFFAEYLGVAYGAHPDIIRIIPVREDRLGRMWGFFSDPALGLSGLPIGLLVRILADPHDPGMPPVFGFLAHELAHRYFGGRVHGHDSPLFSEPFAVVLELKASRMALGEELYRQRVAALYTRAAAASPLASLDRADHRTLGLDEYRYAYAPLLLLTLEQHIGEERFRSLLAALLASADPEPATSGYTYLRQSAHRAGVLATEWQAWEERCVRPAITGNACLQRLVSEP
jgi:hypothetical protein